MNEADLKAENARLRAALDRAQAELTRTTRLVMETQLEVERLRRRLSETLGAGRADKAASADPKRPPL